MAIFLISYGILDAKGKTGRTLVPVPRAALTLAQVSGYAVALGEHLDNIIDGKIVSADVRMGIDISGIVGAKATPVINSDREEGVNMSYTAAGTDYTFGIRIPSVAQALLSGEFIDDSSALVQAFNAGITAGLDISGQNVAASDRYENDLLTFIQGKKTFRKS
jgi:hypothetical protein